MKDQVTIDHAALMEAKRQRLSPMALKKFTIRIGDEFMAQGHRWRCVSIKDGQVQAEQISGKRERERRLRQAVKKGS